MQIAPTQSNVQAALTAFLAAVLPGASAPAIFVGSISGTTLTVSNLPNKSPAGIQGVIQNNVPLLGLGVMPGTTIIRQLGGTVGGTGTYLVSTSQTILSGTMATGVTIVAGQQNRVAEPANPYFAVFTPIRFIRFATNVDTSADAKFSGSIAGTTMTVADVNIGSLVAGATIFGTGVAAGTTIITQLSGSPGGDGAYQIAPSQTVIEGTLSAGQKILTQSAECDVQIDLHSPDTLAGDFAQIISTSLRDEYGVNFFAGLTPPLNGVVPLLADDPSQRPFLNDQNAWEWRWSLDCRLQIYQTIVVPQTYADAAAIMLEDVSALYPP